MKILNFVKIVLLCVMTIGMASCGDDNYYTIQNSDEKLCKYDIWVDETDGGAYGLQFFIAKNKGNEIIITYDEGGKNTVEREFTWSWTDSSKEALKMAFSGGQVKTLNNVWVREHYLLGELNGKVLSFTGKEKL